MNSFRALRLAYRLLRTAALEDRIKLLAKKYPKVSEEDIRKLVTLDPTGGKYLEWLVRQHGELPDQMLDVNSMKTIREILTFYDKVKKSPVLLDRMELLSDINKMTLGYLYYMWAKYKNVDPTSEREKIEKAKKLATKVTYDKNGYKVIKIEGNNEYAPIAACMYAKGTKWCTSDEGKAEYYLKKGPLYILLKDGQKILQTDLKEWKDSTDKEIDIMKDNALSQVLVDSGLLSDPETILWTLNHKYFAGAPRWPAVEPVLAQDPKYAFEYAKKRGERFELGETALASDPIMAANYAIIILRGRFSEAEETIKTDPEWWKIYSNYVEHMELWQKKDQERGVTSSRVLRLAYRLLRIAALEDRIQFYARERGIPEEDLRKLARADPTDGKYLGWLIKNIVDIEGLNDDWLGRLRQSLAFYQTVSRSKNLIEHIGLPGDINKLTLDQVYESWITHKDEDLRSKAEAVKKAKNVAKVFYSNGPYKVLQIGGEGVDPETAIEAACGYSQGTAWCTRTPNKAKGYLEGGPLFLAFKGNERLFLANYRGTEINDVHNEKIQFTDEILFLLLESGLLQIWADHAYSPEKEDRLFDYLVYYLGIYPYKYPELLQYMMDNRLVSQERMARYLEIVGKRLPNVEAYIATDPEASLIYAKYVISEPWPEGEQAIKSVPRYWQDYQKAFKEELAHV